MNLYDNYTEMMAFELAACPYIFLQSAFPI